MVALENIKLASFWRTPRHSFRQTLARARAALSIQTQSASVAVSQPTPLFGLMENKFFRVSFDLDSGGFTIWRKNGETLWQNAAALIATTKGQRSSAETAYARSVQVLKFSDEAGAGQQLIVQCIDRRHELDLEMRLYIFDQRKTVAVEIIGKNVAKEGFTISRMELSPAVLGFPALLRGLQAGQAISSGRVFADVR